MSYAIETRKLTKFYGKARGIVDGDLGVFLQERAQDRRQKVHAEIRGDREAQKPRGRRLHGGDQGIRLACVIQHPASTIIIGQSDLGRADTACRAIQKPRFLNQARRRGGHTQL